MELELSNDEIRVHLTLVEKEQVFELSSKGQSQTEIARILQISESTISRDLDYLRQQSKSNIKRYIDERLPEEYEKCLVGLTAITKEAWNTADNTEDKREKIQALSLAKDCYSIKLDLLTNASVVDDAIRFVSSSHNNKNSSSDNENEKQKDISNQQAIEEEDEERTISTTTTNQVF